jgi:anti-anti-sigma factor
MRTIIDEPGQRIRLCGRLDVTTVADVRSVLHSALDSGTGDFVVDVSGVDVLDATGIGVLVGAHRRAGRRGRRLVLTSLPPRLHRLLVVTRLHRVLHVTDRQPALV